MPDFDIGQQLANEAEYLHQQSEIVKESIIGDELAAALRELLAQSGSVYSSRLKTLAVNAAQAALLRHKEARK